jgi:hypothetical protein
VLVEDNGSIHTSKLSLVALADRAHWICPRTERHRARLADLKAHHLAHQTFADPATLDRAIHHAVETLNAGRTALPLAGLRSPFANTD